MTWEKVPLGLALGEATPRSLDYDKKWADLFNSYM